MSKVLNPKAIQGRKKQSYDSIPPSFMKFMLKSSFPQDIINEVATAMQEGNSKYGKWNWRDVKIELTDYYNSSLRHYLAWSSGEIIDEDSGLNHLTKIISGFCVVYDAMDAGFLVDDRVALIASKDIDTSSFSSYLIDWFSSEDPDISGLIFSVLDLRVSAGVPQKNEPKEKEMHEDIIQENVKVDESLNKENNVKDYL